MPLIVYESSFPSWLATLLQSFCPYSAGEEYIQAEQLQLYTFNIFIQLNSIPYFRADPYLYVYPLTLDVLHVRPKKHNAKDCATSFRHLKELWGLCFLNSSDRLYRTNYPYGLLPCESILQASTIIPQKKCLPWRNFVLGKAHLSIRDRINKIITANFYT